jgi:hypothetical protein
MRLGLIRLTLATISFAIALGIGECVIRVAVPQAESWLAIYQSHPDLPIFSMLPDQTKHVETGETEWTVTTDSQGFRVSTKAQRESECTVLWLGDSFTFGHGVEYDESFVGQIAGQTAGVGHVNTAVAGYGPTEYRRTLEYVTERGMKYDWVFVATYVGNDFHDTQWNKNPAVEDGIIGNQGDLKSFLKRNFHVYRLVTALYHELAGGNQDSFTEMSRQLASPADWEADFLSAARGRYATEMLRIYDYSRRQGQEVAFLILPTRDAAAEAAGRAVEDAEPSVGGTSQREGDDTSEARPLFPVEQAAAIFEEIGARYLDLTPVVAAFPVEETFLRFDGHLTPDANGRVAEAFLQEFDLHCDTQDKGRPLAPRAE